MDGLRPPQPRSSLRQNRGPGLSDNMRGAAFMATAMAGFTFNDALMKHVLGEMGVFQAMLLRGIAATLIIAVLAWRQGALAALPPRRERARIAWRSLGEIGATVLFLSALALLPFATTSAIIQALPLAVTLAAAAFLGEPVGIRRLGAIVAGFCGVLLIVRPGTDGFNAAALLALGSVACIVLRDLATRGLAEGTPSLLVALATAVTITLTGGIGTLVAETWVPVTPVLAVSLLIAAGFLIVGYLFSVKAMRVGDIDAVAPFRYTALVWAMLIGLFVFGEIPDAWMLAGSAVIVAAGLFTLARGQGTPPA